MKETVMIDNVALAKRAWSQAETPIIERSIDDSQPMFDLLAEDVVWKVACPEDTPIFGGEFRGKQAVIDYFTTVNREFQEDAWLERPLEFVGDGDRVLVLGTETYVLSSPKVTISNKEFAIVMDFRDGLIVRMLHITDLSEFVAALSGN